MVDLQLPSSRSAVPNPKAIIFDIGNTIWTENEFDAHRGTDRVLDLATTNPDGLTTDAILKSKAAFEPDLLERREQSLFEMSPYTIQRHIYEPAGIEFELSFGEIEREFWAAATSVVAIEGALEAIREVGANGFRKAVISNSAITGATLQWQLDQLGFAGQFEFVMSSADYGVRKPHPLIFQTAARKLRLAPSEIWYVGDSFDHDITGAKAVGMTPVWFDSADSGIRLQAAKTFHNWGDFLRLLS